MREGPDIARIAALIGDPARANMLTGLIDGRALTASELAALAGVTKQTASAHLAKLLDGGLIAREVQGRHHYFRLGGSDIAVAIEALMGVAQTRVGARTRTGPNDPALRKARVCYDHLAGEMGVWMFDRMIAHGWLAGRDGGLDLSREGLGALRAFGIDVERIGSARRPRCRTCLDWSMRRHHLGGGAGKALFSAIAERGWARRETASRIVRFDPRGEQEFRAWLG